MISCMLQGTHLTSKGMFQPTARGFTVYRSRQFCMQHSAGGSQNNRYKNSKALNLSASRLCRSTVHRTK